MKNSSWSLEGSTVAVELKRFMVEKCAQVRAETRAPGHPMGPISQSFFTAAENGDWREVFESLAAMRQAAREGQSSSSASRLTVVYPVEWAVVNEIGAALEEFAASEEKYAIAFARDIITSIPPGSIYFAGTDPGRFLVTALSKSHANGDPFFTLTQNALADSRSYLRYVRGMYGSRIYVPTEEDATTAFNEYQDDARRRRAEGKLLPGEYFDDTAAGAITEVRGQLSVMAINGALSKLMFDKNPERAFYVEESFPLNWMYPHLSPNGLILKINRQAASELSDEVIQSDHEYWTGYIGPMIGDWLNDDTSLSEITAFVKGVYLLNNVSEKSSPSHPLEERAGERRAFVGVGSAGDPCYVRDDLAQRRFSKLRSSIGGLYVWRAQNCNTPAEKERMLKEADFAFRQAFALCPGSPEVVFRYINLLVGQKCLDNAILVTETAMKVEEEAQPCQAHKLIVESQTSPPQTQLAILLEQLKRMKG